MVDIVLVNLPRVDVSSPLIGMAQLKACLNQHNISSKIIDLNVELWYNLFPEHSQNWDTEDIAFKNEDKFEPFWNKYLKSLVVPWIHKIKQHNPEWLGVTIFSQRNKSAVFEFLKLFRELCPNIKIVCGGPYINSVEGLLMSKGLADVCILGEAEEQLVLLLKGAELNKGLNQIDDLNSLPFPDYSDSNFDIYYNTKHNMNDVNSSPFGCKILYIMSSRGCVRNCTFCNVNSIFPNFRFRSGESIALELKYQSKRHGIDKFYFVDSLINGNPEALLNQCEKIIQLELNIKWRGHLICKSKSQTDPHLFELMGKSGCNLVIIGVESGSQKVRQHMRKRFTNEDLLYTLSLCEKNNISAVLLFLIGYPTETENDFQMSLDLINDTTKYRKSIKHIYLGTTMEMAEGSPIIEMAKSLEIAYDKNGQWYNDTSTREVRMDRLERMRHFCNDLNLPTNQLL